MSIYLINREDNLRGLLSGEHYFESLLKALYSNNVLSTVETESIQLQLLDIITETVGYYTRQESSSVPVETAERIILSIYYTIGLFLKSKLSLRESIDLIKNKEMRHLFSEGERILREKVSECRRLYEIALETRLKTENYAYIDTLDYAIPQFFKEYDMRFGSHETMASIDYPLAIDVVDLSGVEYIEDYLSKLILENKFCSCFEAEEIEALLRSFNRDSHHMLVNIFNLVLTNYLGRILRGKGGRSLEITEGDRGHLKVILEGLSRDKLEEAILSSAERIFRELSIEDWVLTQYIKSTLLRLVPEIEKCIETDALEGLFISLREHEERMLRFEDGESLPNSIFREITEEIRACSTAAEKIGIIREEIRSLKDLVDVLSADCIFEDEFVEIFKTLGDFEIALLIKSASTFDALGDEYGTESEKEWYGRLKEYLEGVDERRREEIISLSQGIEL